MRLKMFNLYDYNTDDHVGGLIHINPDKVVSLGPVKGLPGATDVYLDGRIYVPRLHGYPYEIARELVSE